MHSFARCATLASHPFDSRLPKLADRTVTLDRTRLTGSDGLELTADGRVILNADSAPALDINARARSVPASLANAFVPGLGAKGAISGTVVATGSPQAPAVRYDSALGERLRQPVDIRRRCFGGCDCQGYL